MKYLKICRIQRGVERIAQQIVTTYLQKAVTGKIDALQWQEPYGENYRLIL